MLSQQLITSQYPILTLNDTVSLALQFMDDFDIQHLPVTSDNKYVGLISKDDLHDADETSLLLELDQD